MIHYRPIKTIGSTSNEPVIAPNMTWYDLGSFIDLADYAIHPAPEYNLPFLVEGKEVTIYRGSSEQEVALGYMPLLVKYMGVVLPVGQDGYYPYYLRNPDNYYMAVSISDELTEDRLAHVFLGVES